jgi:DNA topoisomerase-1
MAKNVVVVESPAKAKTIEKYLGKDFKVFASYGHVRDLLPKTGAVETDNNFLMHYEAIDRNKKHVETIVKALKGAEALYLAPDPDREGEAIAWHLWEMLKKKRGMKDLTVHRVTFNEITKKAVTHAVENPHNIMMNLVDAQQARRALDYLVGFNLSPLLWKKVARGLSAGRVQSPALRLIVDRELEIEAFEAREYWSIEADLTKEKHDFLGKLTYLDTKKMTQFDVDNTKDANDIRAKLETAAAGFLTVTKVEKKKRKRNPSPPFTTSTLQQDASRKCGFGAQRTMVVAQQLYEGIDIGGEHVGLITYMRTDSVNLSNDAIEDFRAHILEKYGKEYLPEKPNVYKTKAKNAQEAHEAIRPSDITRTPDSLKAKLKPEQLKLYALIYKRALACQMAPAQMEVVSIDMDCGKMATFRTTGSTVVFPGFLGVYQEGTDTPEEKSALLPPIAEGEKIDLNAIRAEQHFTEPPPRYSEATLVKSLEEHGIGRPSTYASIIATLIARKYATLEQKRFHPTDVGRVVAKFLTDYFNQYVDYDFTATLEDELDAIARGEAQWIPVLEKFWKPFIKNIEHITETVKKSDVTEEALDEECPECKKPLSIKLGRTGRFVACTGYPECRYTRNLKEDGSAEPEAPEIVEDRKCPKCESDLVIKTGRYGKFIGCSKYPDCKHMEPLNKPKETGVDCPECKKGHILERKSRRGKIFYSCSLYPKCKYAIWNEPLEEPCPNCKWPILQVKTTKKHGAQKVCAQDGCGFAESMAE